MITKFGTVYAGHVDLPDMGQDATPANERRFSNEHLATVFDKTDAVAKVMDELGYYVIWLAEHHFQHEGYEALPNLLMSAVHLSHVTKQIRSAAASTSRPCGIRPPGRGLRDRGILTKGRWRGPRLSHARVETFGAPMLDAEANRELFEGAGRDFSRPRRSPSRITANTAAAGGALSRLSCAS